MSIAERNLKTKVGVPGCLCCLLYRIGVSYRARRMAVLYIHYHPRYGPYILVHLINGGGNKCHTTCHIGSPQPSCPPIASLPAMK